MRLAQLFALAVSQVFALAQSHSGPVTVTTTLCIEPGITIEGSGELHFGSWIIPSDFVPHAEIQQVGSVPSGWTSPSNLIATTATIRTVAVLKVKGAAGRNVKVTLPATVLQLGNNAFLQLVSKNAAPETYLLEGTVGSGVISETTVFVGGSLRITGKAAAGWYDKSFPVTVGYVDI